MQPKYFNRFEKDPRIIEAKKLILESLNEHRQTLTGIKAPDPNRVQEYAELIDSYGQQRGGNLWFPFIGSGIGNGPFVELLDGSVKYDFISGIGVYHFGHSHPDLILSSIDAALSDTTMQGHLQQNKDQVELVDLLIKQSGLDHCFLTTAGSMANENGLKIAFQKNYPANRVLAFEHAFCGRTLALSQITEKHNVRVGLPVTIPVDYIPFFDPDKPEESTCKAIHVLKKVFCRYPKQHALMICELIQGEGGFYPGSAEFFRAIMTLLKDQGVAVLVDEVQTFGRTSELFAYRHFEIEDLVDIVTIGKMSQVCATLFRSAYKPNPGLLSQTFTSSTQAIHAAKTMIQMMIKENFFGKEGKNLAIHQYFVKQLEEIHKRHPSKIKGPYGLGAMVAFSPLNGEFDQVKAFVDRLFHAGVLSFVCGKNPTRTRFLVPVGAISMRHIDQVCQIVEEVLLCS